MSRSLLAVAVALVFSTLALSPAAHAGDVKLIKQPSSFPLVISQSGSYRLKSNITVPDANTTAISVQADNVTIDLNGFSILGPCTGGSPCSPTGTGVGIKASPHTNTTVKNGIVQGMGSHGILLNIGRVEKVSALSNGGNGIQSLNGPTAVVDSSGDDNNANGVATFGPTTVTNSIANNNGLTGISTGGLTTITNSTANYNRGAGQSLGIFYAGISADAGSITVTDSTANNNAGDGINIDIDIFITPPPSAQRPHLTITNSSASNNGSDGVRIGQFANSIAVTNGTMNGNGARGIDAASFPGTVADSTASYNTTDGIFSTGALTVTGSNAFGNGGTGINGYTATGSTANSNGGAQINAFGIAGHNICGTSACP